MQLVSLATKYFQFLVLHLPVLLPLLAVIKILKLFRYLELLILVSENKLTQLHGQNKGNVSQMEETKKKQQTAVPSPTSSAKLGDSKINPANTEILQCLGKLIYRWSLLLETQAVTSTGVTRRALSSYTCSRFLYSFKWGSCTSCLLDWFHLGRICFTFALRFNS